MKLARNSRIIQIRMPVVDLCSLLTMPAFRCLLVQQGHLLKVNMQEEPFGLFVRAEMVPLLCNLPDNPVTQRLQVTLISLQSKS